MKLFPYQETGVDFLTKRQYALLADEMGLGKSAVTIVAAKDLGLKKILVLCPASIKYNWEREFKIWYPELTTQVINGTSAKMKDVNVWIMNYDICHAAGILRQALLNRKYDLVIADEVHYCKTPTSKRSRAFYKQRGYSYAGDRVWCLTGTPVMNRPVEIFPMLRRFVPGRLLKYTDFFTFTKKFCAAYQGKWGWDASGASNLEELAEYLDGFMIRRLKKDVMTELPDKVFQKIVFDPLNAVIGAKIKAEKATYDRDQALGAIATLRREIGVFKIPLIIEHLTNVLEEKDKIIVFGYHREVLESLFNALSKFNPVLFYGGLSAAQKRDRVDAFVNTPEHRVFIGQIDAAGIGIDGLQKVADTVIFAELSYVPGAIKQAIDRCHRIGQKNKVLVQFLTMKGGIEEDIFDALERKSGIIKTITAVKQEVFKMKRSIEENIERIADALVGIMAIIDIKSQKAGPIPEPTMVVTPEEQADPFVEEAPKAKAPKTKAPKTETAPAYKNSKEFLAYANKIILAIEDKAKAKTIVTRVMGAVKEELGAATLVALKPEDLMRAKELFDEIVAEEKGE